MAKATGAWLLQRPGRGWVGRWVDPVTGKRRDVTLDRHGIVTAAQRERWLQRKRDEIAEHRRAAKLGVVLSGRTLVGDAVERYLADVKARLEPVTVYGYGVACRDFAAWCLERGRRHSEEITGAELFAYRDAVVATGRAPRTTNKHLRMVRACLAWLRKRSLVLLTGDQIKDACEAALVVPRSAPRCLRAAEIARLLDVASRFEPECLAFTLTLLLTGMRRGEAEGLLWDELDLEAGEIRLGIRTKTKAARTIDLSVCPSLVGVLEALPRTSPRVFPQATRAITKSWNLAMRGRPSRLDGAAPEPRSPDEWTWKDLRSTCGTWLTCAPGIWGASSVYRTAKQLGHTVEIAERFYLGVIRGISPTARTLEEAMGLSPASYKGDKAKGSGGHQS